MTIHLVIHEVADFEGVSRRVLLACQDLTIAQLVAESLNSLPKTAKQARAIHGEFIVDSLPVYQVISQSRVPGLVQQVLSNYFPRI